MKIYKKIYNSRCKSKITFVKDRLGHDFRYALNSNKIRRKLKWKPIYNFEKGLMKTLDHYLSL